LTRPALEPFFLTDGDTFVPNDIAHGGWGPTLGGQVVGGLLARAVEQQRADPELIPARFTVDILRRVATAPVQVHADVVRTGRRMQAIDARLTQGGELVARASTLLLRRGDQPRETPWTTTLSMPQIPQEPAQFDGSFPMFITPYGGDASDYTFPWQHDGPRYAWIREIRPLVDGIAVGSASLFDAHGPIGSSLTTAAANSNFRSSVGARDDGLPDQSSADE